MNKRMIFMVLMVVFFSGVVIQTVEAGIFDPFTSGSSMFVGKAKTFQSDYLTKQRIANYFVLGIVFILLGTAYFKWGKSDSSGSSDGSQQYFYYVLLFILAIIVVIQVVDDPTQYIWEKEMVQDTKEFLIGGSGCRLEEGGVFTSAINIKHGYTRKAGSSNELICKHPILRTGEGGRGLPVFLIAFIVILLVLKKYQKN